jgi:hypothetical protein
MVVLFFLLKKAPLLIEPVWSTWPLVKGHTMRVFVFMYLLAKSFYVMFTDFDIIFHSGFMVLVVFGLVIHPFFFVFCLIDFLRIDVLKNVVKAIYNPLNELGLSFMLFMIGQYYFTLIGYIVLHEDYRGNCDELWHCYI